MDAKVEMDCVSGGLNGDGRIGFARLTGLCLSISLFA